MATTRPEASETTGTLRETSGVTAPVTTSWEVVGCALAATNGNCSGWSTWKRLRSTSDTTSAGGGASAAASRRPLQPKIVSVRSMETRRRPISRPLHFIKKSISATTDLRRPSENAEGASRWGRSRRYLPQVVDPAFAWAPERRAERARKDEGPRRRLAAHGGGLRDSAGTGSRTLTPFRFAPLLSALQQSPRASPN